MERIGNLDCKYKDKNPSRNKLMIRMETLKGKQWVTFHTYLVGLVEAILFKISHKYHGFIIITGNVGDGKSTLAVGISALAQQIRNRELTFDNCVWTTEAFIEKTERGDNFGEVIWWDEAVKGATGKKMGLTSQGTELMEALVTKRFKQHLYILLIDDIVRYSDTIIKMAQAWINVKSFGVKRGYWEAYTNKAKISYIYDWFKIKKKTMFPTKVRPDNSGKFMDYTNMFLEESQYDKMKLEETNRSNEKKKEKVKTLTPEQKLEEKRKQFMTQEVIEAYRLSVIEKQSQAIISAKLGYHINTIRSWLSKIRREGIVVENYTTTLKKKPIIIKTRGLGGL